MHLPHSLEGSKRNNRFSTITGTLKVYINHQQHFFFHSQSLSTLTKSHLRKNSLSQQLPSELCFLQKVGSKIQGTSSSTDKGVSASGYRRVQQLPSHPKITNDVCSLLLPTHPSVSSLKVKYHPTRQAETCPTGTCQSLLPGTTFPRTQA